MVTFAASSSLIIRRSREGAWIEMPLSSAYSRKTMCRSREGAWIEMPGVAEPLEASRVAPVRERGLKYCYPCFTPPLSVVAPVRERGLK